MKHIRLGNRRIYIPALLALIGIGAFGFAHRHGTDVQTPVGPWDYIDRPNTHPMAHPGTSMPLPNNLVEAHDGIATTQGITVRLQAISKGNSDNWEHWWNTSGGPLDESPRDNILVQPDQPQRTDGRFRGLIFDIQTEHPIDDVSYIGYVPNGARQGLTSEEKIFHGWDLVQNFRFERYPQSHIAGVFVDDLAADSFLVGLASGEWKTIGTSPSTLTKPLAKSQIVAKGPWGTVSVVDVPNPGIAFSASKSAWPGVIRFSIDPPSEPLDQELRLRGFDAKGTEITIQSKHNQASIPIPSISNIVRFEIQARPYVYLEFNHLSFDPKPSLWTNIVWGANQPTKSVRLGSVRAELQALIGTRLGTKEWNKQQYIARTVYTVDGHIWRDHPTEFDGITSPVTEFIPKFDPPTRTLVPPKHLPQPWVAALRFSGLDSGDQKGEGTMEVLGSDSGAPGEGLHSDWNLTPLNWNQYGQVKPLPQGFWASFALKPQVKFAQIQLDVASGPWVKVAEVIPDPNEIKPRGPDYRVYTVELGSKAHVRFRDTGNEWVDHISSNVSLEGQQVRLVARLRSGTKKMLKVTSYQQYSGRSGLVPKYDFDRDATETEGDMLALSDVSTFDVEARPIKREFLVVKVPEK